MRKFLCLFVVVFGVFVGASPKRYALGAIPVTDYRDDGGDREGKAQNLHPQPQRRALIS
ncbi:MAG: hypothetical protein J6P38_05865 [Acetobacter sp.]|nr:hypothetical protein [Acetobacter sp.]